MLWGGLDFKAYDSEATAWKEVGAVYIFVKHDTTREYVPDRWIPLYVGKAKNFKNRLSDHEKWQIATDLGMTQVHVLVEEEESKRRDIEQRLIELYQPLLNH